VAFNSASQFRRSGQRDDRRRRLFAEEAFGASSGRRVLRRRSSASGPDELPPRKWANYGDAEFMEEAPRLIDLVPRRLPVFAAILTAGLTAIVGLELLYSYGQSAALVELTHDKKGVAAFDLDGEGSLAVWFSSTTLSLAALTALLVYSVRRYRTDDYQGRYRIWLWAAMCWLLMSIDETGSLHEGFKEMMVAVTGARLFGDGSIWWVVPYFFLLGAVGSRLLVDMWECRLASAALLTAAGCYVLAVVTQLQWILPESGARGVMLEEGAEMLGNWLLFLAMGLYARHVILDAEGLLPRGERAGGHVREGVDDEWIMVDEPHRTPGLRRRRRRAAKAAARSAAARTVRSDLEVEPDFEYVEQEDAEVAEPEDDLDPPNPIGRKLTKQEKKALRKRLMRERIQRERQQRKKWKGG